MPAPWNCMAMADSYHGWKETTGSIGRFQKKNYNKQKGPGQPMPGMMRIYSAMGDYPTCSDDEQREIPGKAV